MIWNLTMRIAKVGVQILKTAERESPLLNKYWTYCRALYFPFPWTPSARMRCCLKRFYEGDHWLQRYTLCNPCCCDRFVAFLHNELRCSKIICSSRDTGSDWKVWRMDVGMPLQKVENRVLVSIAESAIFQRPSSYDRLIFAG